VVQADGSVVRDWRVGTRSYAAVLGYNRSYFYATAVLEFAQMLAAARSGAPAGTRSTTAGTNAERAASSTSPQRNATSTNGEGAAGERGATAAAATATPVGEPSTPRPAEASAGSR
jgi:hypothetical protein